MAAPCIEYILLHNSALDIFLAASLRLTCKTYQVLTDQSCYHIHINERDHIKMHPSELSFCNLYHFALRSPLNPNWNQYIPAINFLTALVRNQGVSALSNRVDLISVLHQHYLKLKWTDIVNFFIDSDENRLIRRCLAAVIAGNGSHIDTDQIGKWLGQIIEYVLPNGMVIFPRATHTMIDVQQFLRWCSQRELGLTPTVKLLPGHRNWAWLSVRDMRTPLFIYNNNDDIELSFRRFSLTGTTERVVISRKSWSDHLMRGIIAKGCAQSYFHIMSIYRYDYTRLFQLWLIEHGTNMCFYRSHEITKDILDNFNGVISPDTLGKFIKSVNLPHVWYYHGRAEFESTYHFLVDKFRVNIDPYKVFQGAVRLGSFSLIEYMTKVRMTSNGWVIADSEPIIRVTLDMSMTSKWLRSASPEVVLHLVSIAKFHEQQTPRGCCIL